MVPPTTRTRVTGGSWPARIWQLLMAEALANRPIVDFHAPPTGALGLAVDVTPRNVPAVVGMPVDRAEEALAREGFATRRRTVPDREYPPGTVISQSPSGGESAPGGSTVVLTVAGAQKAEAEVPDVLGQAHKEATAALTEAGFQVEAVVEPEADAAKAASRPGVVWKQSPGSPGPTDAGATITIWVNPG
jgi:serine/threonine-protein kinase